MFKPLGSDYSNLNGDVNALPSFIEWAKANCREINGYKSDKYCSLLCANDPFNDSYSAGVINLRGDVLIETSNGTTMDMCVFVGRFKVSLKIAVKGAFKPIPHYRTYSPKYNGKRSIESWEVPGIVAIKKRLDWWDGKTDWRECELVMTWDQFESQYFK
jgi:hypothetical protein